MKIFPLVLGISCLFSGCHQSIATDECAPIVESSRSETSFGMRAPGEGCAIDEDSYRRAVRRWLDRRATDTAPIEHFYLGRVIDYPWISQHLARAAIRSPEWDLKTGTSKNTDIHPYILVESFLLQEEFRQRLDAPFVDTPYTIGHFDTEKVLIGDASTVLAEYEENPGKVPFDTLLAVYLVKR